MTGNAAQPLLWGSAVDRRIIDATERLAMNHTDQTGLMVFDAEETTLGANVTAADIMGFSWKAFIGLSTKTRTMPVFDEDGRLVPEDLLPPGVNLRTGLDTKHALLGFLVPSFAVDETRGGQIRWTSTDAYVLRDPATNELIGALCAFTAEPDGDRLRRAQALVARSHPQLMANASG